MRAALLLIVGCSPALPDEPSFQQHVAPILAANCVRCHGAPAIGGAPPGFRLDMLGSFEQPVRGRIELVAGAALYAAESAHRAAAGDMPPRFPLDDYQIEILERWAALDAPRGAPNPGNREPFVGSWMIQPAAGTYLIDIEIRDPDPDVVGGVLFARGVTQTVALGALRSGPNALRWDTTTSPVGSYAIEAILDDGGVEVTVPLDEILVVR
jgi:hypothetical protein